MTMKEPHPSVIAAASSNAEDQVSYRVSDTLNFRGGYMIVIRDECHITVSTQLSEEEQAYGKAHMLQYRQALIEREGGTYWWCADGDDQPQWIGGRTPER